MNRDPTIPGLERGVKARVLLLGGGGFVGQSLAAGLARQGVEVVVPTRRLAARGDLRVLPGVQLLAADIHDDDSLVALCTEVDAVINLVGILHDRDTSRPYGKRFATAHVELPRRLAATMHRTGVHRLLHMSALNAATDAPSAYLRSKAAGEHAVLDNIGAIDATVFRPSVIFGRNDVFLNRFADLARSLPVLPIVGGRTRFQPVYVGDVVAAFIAALNDRDSFAKVYELGGPTVYTLRQLVAYAATACGHPRPVVDLPDPLAHVQARLLGLLPNPPLSPDNLRSLQKDSVADGQHEFPGWRPQPLEVIVPGYLSKS